MRDALYEEWSVLGVFGRVYLANEGINAQISVPEHNWEKFVEVLHAREGSRTCIRRLQLKMMVILQTYA